MGTASPSPQVKGTNMRYHGVQYDDDGHLPDGCDWAFIEIGADLVFLCKRHRWSPGVMAEAWTEYCEASAA